MLDSNVNFVKDNNPVSSLFTLVLKLNFQLSNHRRLMKFERLVREKYYFFVTVLNKHKLKLQY